MRVWHGCGARDGDGDEKNGENYELRVIKLNDGKYLNI